eukprot:c9770_g1_i1.p1 GENE.c9770_g1_i1~~c9770_g1_i1.p1  ORF type:complete len:934 (+),score=267.46 c9770_g1_i1:185-2803(+)
MSDEETTLTATPIPDPTPTPQLYPDEDDISWKILQSIRTILQMAHCNITAQYSLPLATEIWKRLPDVKHATDVCPRFLRENPTFPETPTPSPPPVPLNSEDRNDLDAIRSADISETSKKLLTEEVNTKAFDRATEKAELEGAETQMAPLPVVPEDCGDDYTGSVGLRNDEVSGISVGMNRNFNPVPALYPPKGNHEDLALREQIVGARPTTHELLALLQERAVATECTKYKAMKIANAQPMEELQFDFSAECERACIFDDDCVAWIFQNPPLGRVGLKREATNCKLLNSSVVPSLVDGAADLVTGLCPKSKICSQTLMQQILAVTHTPAAVTAGCPTVLEQIIAGSALNKRSACVCVNHIRNNNKNLITSDCLLSPEALPWNSVLNMCETVDVPDLLQRTTNAKCQGTATFSSGQGGCATYNIEAPLSNNVHCSTDYDKQQHVFAYQACPECGRCIATPTPTPYIPEPELATGFALPNGATTPCLAARQSAAEELGTGPLMGYYAPQCFRDGSFMPTQCLEMSCWCVYDNGVEIPDSRHSIIDRGTRCRAAPPMAPVYPSFPEPVVNVDLQVIRAIGKLVYSDVIPDLFCRFGVNTTFPGLVAQALHYHHIRNPTADTCPIRHPVLTVNLQNVLNHLAHVLVADPIRRYTPSTSPSPSPSLSATISVSPSPSPSAPLPMCGDVTCRDLGINVHMYQHVPAGWCHLCLEGTSGPCRDSTTYACHDYMIGNQCRYNHHRCADAPVDVHPNARGDCDERSGDHMEFSGQVLLSTPHHEDFLKIWSVTVSSAIADITGIHNLCEILIEKATDDNGRLALSFSIARKDLEDINKNADAVREAINNGALVTALRHRGLPVIGDEITLVADHIKGVIGK